MSIRGAATLQRNSRLNRHSVRNRVLMMVMDDSEAPWLSNLNPLNYIGAWKWDFETQIVTAQQRVYDLFQVCRDTSRNSLLQIIKGVHPEDRSGLSQSFERFVDRKARLDTVFRVICPSQEERWMHMMGRADRTNGVLTSISGVLIDVTRHHKLASATISELSSRQKKLSYELTDELGQQLAGLLIRVEMVKEKVEDYDTDGGAVREIEQVISSLRSAQVFTRQLSHRASPALITASELPEKLEILARVKADNVNGLVSFYDCREVSNLDDYTSCQLYLMAENALDLILNESRCRNAELTLSSKGGQACLELKAESGLPDELEQSDLIRKIRRRAKLLGGTITLSYQDPAFLRCQL